MRKILMIITVIGLVLNAGCRSSKSGAKTLPQPIAEDHSSGEYIFPEGVYYTYNFNSSPAYDFELPVAVASLHKRGFCPIELWFKPGASSCVPPGSDMAMTVIVEPVLLLRFKKQQKGLEKLGYEIVSEPSAGSCAYVVKRYSF